MSAAKHTPGPWRWEISMHSKRLHLVGGQPRQYDLTIMDFDRWGMSNAVATLRDPAHDGMNIMHRLPDRKDWIAPFPGREHHADWCASVRHPDMRLIEAAPDLLAALVEVTDRLDAFSVSANLNTRLALETARAAIAKATGGAL